MIKIYESVMANSTLISYDTIMKVLKSDDAIKFIKSKYKDIHRASIDLATAINALNPRSAIARPVLDDVYYKFNDSNIDSLFIELKSELYDVYDKKSYKVDGDKIKLNRSSKRLDNISPSDKYNELLYYLRSKASGGESKDE